MHEYRADLWKLGLTADAVVITTNGDVKKDGTAVMGKGCAKEAALRDPQLPKRLGLLLSCEGNSVHVLHGWHEKTALVTFPVKHHWYENADINLVCESTLQLVKEADLWDWDDVILPRPGCGAGKLQWPNVWKLISVALDDRFTVVWK